MYGFIILTAVAMAIAAGWLAQIVIGKRRMMEVNWPQAGAVGLIATGIGVLVSTLVYGRLSGFGPLGLAIAVVGAFVIEAIWISSADKERHEERERQKEMTPEGLPGHHQPQHHPKKKKRR
jgi:hypothetical protein